MTLSAKVAVNPLPWVLGPNGFDLSPATVREAVAGIAEAGFTAMHADVPPDMSVADYRTLLSDHGVRPAPGYFGAHFDGPADDLPALVERAKQHAAGQLELGLSEAFLASHLNPTRIASPAVGAGFDPDRLELIIERIDLLAAAIRAEGLTPCLHSHIGSWIETEHEVRTTLDSIDDSVLAFGPDTGHLLWGGSDPAALVADYAERVRAMHLKDVHLDAAAKARERGDNYQEATQTQHVWAEPGRGDVDFAAVFAALPTSYDGWFVVEVDVPDLPTKEESTRASAEWVAAQPARVISSSFVADASDARANG